MGIKFWIIRAIKVFTGVLLALFVVELIKGHAVQDSILFALTWSDKSTSKFITTRVYYSHKGEACTLCNDTPDTSSMDTPDTNSTDT